MSGTRVKQKIFLAALFTRVLEALCQDPGEETSIYVFVREQTDPLAGRWGWGLTVGSYHPGSPASPELQDWVGLQFPRGVMWSA